MDKLEDKFKKQEEKNKTLFSAMNKPAVQSQQQPAPIQESTPVKKRELDNALPELPPEEQITSIKDLDTFSKKVRTGLDKENQEWIKAQAERLKELNAEAKKVYQEDKSRIDKARLGAAIARGLTHIGYALAGVRTGAEGGPLQFNKMDWESDYNRVLQEYKSALRTGQGEIDSEAKGYKARTQERSQLGEERINRSERILRLKEMDEDRMRRDLERKRREARQDALRAEREKNKKKPKDLAKSEEEKVKKDFRKIEKLRAEMAEATSPKERARKLGDIYVLLNQTDKDEKSIEELDKLQKEDKNEWWNLFGEDTDLFGKHIESIKTSRLDMIRRMDNEEQNRYNSEMKEYKQDSKQQSSSKPKTVIQNGITYTLNPKTNEYE